MDVLDLISLERVKKARVISYEASHLSRGEPPGPGLVACLLNLLLELPSTLVYSFLN